MGGEEIKGIAYDEEEDIYIVDFERVGEREWLSCDGSVRITCDCTVEENTLSVTVHADNLSQTDLTADIRPFIMPYTDLTDPDMVFTTTADYAATKIAAGDSVEQVFNHDLEEGWSEANVTVQLKFLTSTSLTGADVKFSAEGMKEEFSF